jgi:arylsulfatase A-like enzyme
MTRREFIRSTTAAVVAAGVANSVIAQTLSQSLPSVAAPRRKLNVLLIWTDQQRFDTLAAYGNNFIQAPTLNKLASQSVIFQRHYVAQAVCTPSRATVMTGLYPHQHQCIVNNSLLNPQIRCLPELLSDPSYRTGYIGKWHLGDEIFPQHGFEEWQATEDGYDVFFSPGHDQKQRSAYHHWLVEKGYKPDVTERNAFSRKYCTTLPIEHCKPAFIAEKAVDFLQRYRNESFILSCNYLEPHNPFNGPLNGLHDPAALPLPDNCRDDLDGNDPLRYRLNAEQSASKQRADNFAKLRETYAIYYGMISQVDRSVASILKAVDDLGLAENTIVVFTSDHGEMMGSHGMSGKTFMFEESVRTPLMFCIPGVAGGRKISQPVCNVDIVPTVLELLGSKAGESLPGQSLVPLMQGKPPAEDHVFMEWNAQVGPDEDKPAKTKASAIATPEQVKAALAENTRAVVSPDGWKFCLSDADKGQLYHLAADPGETTNLFSSPPHRDVVERLTKRIHDWQLRTGDTLKV